MEVYVTAKQWMWKFTHPERAQHGAGTWSCRAAGACACCITSRDVIHSFYVPAFRIKQDAVPGRYTTIWFQADRTGTFQALCAEYCGVGHSRMWADVVVLSPADYAAWQDGDDAAPVAKAQANARIDGGRFADESSGDLVTQGERAAQRAGCFACHTTDGQPHIGPTWRGLYGSTVRLRSGRTVKATEDYLTESMMDPQAKIVRGLHGRHADLPGHLSQPDVAAIIEYIKSLRTTGEPPKVHLPKVVPALPGGGRGVADGGPARSVDGGAP